MNKYSYSAHPPAGVFAGNVADFCSFFADCGRPNFYCFSKVLL